MRKSIFKNRYSTLGLFCTLFLAACGGGGGGSGSANTTNLPSNATLLTIGSGYNGQGWNRPYITVTICASNTTTCQTFDHVLIDSGSTGFRVDQSQLSGAMLAALQPVTYNDLPLYQCMQYAAGYDFGPVVRADVKVSGEVASDIPIQIFNDTQPEPTIPMACTEGQGFADLTALGAQAIIGVNVFSNPNNNYTNGGVYTCVSESNCTQVNDPTTIPTVLNINPVAAFESDNNGVIFNLPDVPNATTSSMQGTVVFGLNTESNNIVPNDINTVLGNPSYSYQIGAFYANTGSLEQTLSIFDSGTPTFDFYYTGINTCSGIVYCPTTSPQTWNSTIFDYNTESHDVELVAQIVNYSTSTGNYALLPGIGAVASPSGDLTIYGLPFFFGKSVYLGFMGESSAGVMTPLGMGPAWGFASN
jgi:hypothetical protein